jgi:ribosome biogenesis protein Nip4
VLRSGLTKTSTTIISVIPNDVIANILSSYTKEFVSMLKENPDLINSYNNLFAINAGVEFKNYVNYNSATPNTNKLDEYLSSVENSELLSLINYTNLKETLDNNQDKLFLFGNNANGIAESKETGVFQSASNTLAVPLKQKGGVSKTALWTDATYESNIQAINDALDAAEVQKQNGVTLVIPSNGINMVNGVSPLAVGDWVVSTDLDICVPDTGNQQSRLAKITVVASTTTSGVYNVTFNTAKVSRKFIKE